MNIDEKEWLELILAVEGLKERVRELEADRCICRRRKAEVKQFEAKVVNDIYSPTPKTPPTLT